MNRGSYHYQSPLNPFFDVFVYPNNIINIFDKSVGQTLSVGGSQYVNSDDDFTTKERLSGENYE